MCLCIYMRFQHNVIPITIVYTSAKLLYIHLTHMLYAVYAHNIIYTYIQDTRPLEYMIPACKEYNVKLLCYGSLLG